MTTAESVTLYDDPNRYADRPGLTITGRRAHFTGYQKFVLTPTTIAIDGDDKLQRKDELVLPLFDRSWLTGRTVADLGANAGYFCFKAILNGASAATAIDIDEEYLSMVTQVRDTLGFQRLRILKTNVVDYREPVDLVLAFALIHWIYSCTAIYGSLTKAIEHLAYLTHKALVIEWIDPSDEAIESFGHIKWNEHATTEPYTRENFESALRKFFPVVEIVGIVRPTRILYVAYKSSAYRPIVLPSVTYNELLVSLLYRILFQEGAADNRYRALLEKLAPMSTVKLDTHRLTDFSYVSEIIATHGSFIYGRPTPLMEYLYPPEQTCYSRTLAEVEGMVYQSRVYIVSEEGIKRVIKQATADLASREAAFLNQFDSPFFPKVIRTWSRSNWSVLELEFVEGELLSKAKQEFQQMHTNDLLLFLDDCLTILAELRCRNITHRDIRLDNIIVRNGRPVLIDFGWAISPDNACITPPGLGGEGVPRDDEFCDVYAMGMVFRELCFLKPEFAHVVEAMTKPSREERITDIHVLKSMLRKDSPSPQQYRDACLCIVEHYRKRQQSAEAEQMLTALVAHNGPDPNVLVQLGEVQLSEEKFDSARATFREALQLAPNKAKVHFYLASILKATGDLNGAYQEFSDFLHRVAADDGYGCPDGDLNFTALAHNELAALEYTRGRIDRGIEHLLHAVEFDPANLTVLKNLADLLHESNQPERALAVYKKILDLSPNDAETLFILGNVCLETGRYQDARFFYERVLQVAPDHEPAKRNLIALEVFHEQKLGEPSTQRVAVVAESKETF